MASTRAAPRRCGILTQLARRILPRPKYAAISSCIASSLNSSEVGSLLQPECSTRAQQPLQFAGDHRANFTVINLRLQNGRKMETSGLIFETTIPPYSPPAHERNIAPLEAALSKLAPFFLGARLPVEQNGEL